MPSAALLLLLLAQSERYIAVDNVCAWPNLTLLPNGQIAAHLFNHPSHGQAEGDVETWLSADGKFWTKQGTPAPHDPETARMNHAAGLANNGDLIVITGGWGGPKFRGHLLKPLVARSSDQGRTWTRQSMAWPHDLVPFGDVIRMGGRLLAVPMYDGKANSLLFFSDDDGRTWGKPALIGQGQYNETAVLRLRADRWLAALRTVSGAIDLFVSADEGQSWTRSQALTPPSHHPGHLLRLVDGRLLLTYGIREKSPGGAPDYALGVRFSKDEGRSWGAPARILSLSRSTDGGYPSTVQLGDGTLVTAYYSNGIPEHKRYHMGVLRWKP